MRNPAALGWLSLAGALVALVSTSALAEPTTTAEYIRATVGVPEGNNYSAWKDGTVWIPFDAFGSWTPVGVRDGVPILLSPLVAQARHGQGIVPDEEPIRLFGERLSWTVGPSMASVVNVASGDSGTSATRSSSSAVERATAIIAVGAMSTGAARSSATGSGDISNLHVVGQYNITASAMRTVSDDGHIAMEGAERQELPG